MQIDYIQQGFKRGEIKELNMALDAFLSSNREVELPEEDTQAEDGPFEDSPEYHESFR